MNTVEKTLNQITTELAVGMFSLIKKYPGFEGEICRLMAAQLCSFIAVSATDPATALVFYANRLAQFQWEEVRSDYFANTLGVQNTVPANKPLCEVTPIAPDRRTRDPVCADTEPLRGDGNAGEATGDPRAKKPD